MTHQYVLGGHHIVLDVYSGSVHLVDEVAYDVIGLYETHTREEIIDAMGKLLRHGFENGFLVMIFKHGDDLVGYFIHHMHRTGADIQNDVVSAQFILMNHRFVLLL